jgi:hypothetical protein
MNPKYNYMYVVFLIFQFLFHLEVLPDNWLVAVERPQLDLYSSLPEALKRKKFGT